MKLTKKLEKEVMATYETYWDSYLNGNVAAISSLLDESYSQVGSAETEVFSNKKDAVQFLHDTINQVAGKLAMRNRSTRLEQQGNFLLFHELCDLYALAEPEWIFYSKFRATTIMGEKTDGWKIIHQHSSFPDARTGEGENLAIDKVAEENRQLREAIKRCTVELEHKNRELEIESSLERVRAVAMSMQKAEGLLDVVEILNTELKTLGFTDIRNTIINIFNDTKQKFLNYDYSDYGVGGISEVDYNSHPSNKKFVNKMREASKDFMITKFTGNELDEWRKWRIDQGQMPDSKLDQAESLYYYEFSIGVGSIGISTFRPINADQLKILSKIRNVFSLAYQRYLDIALAEAQAREAQIEASLERVRAVAMSMMRSNDLMEVSKTLLTELNTLGFENIRNTQIDILNDDKGSFLNYEYSDYGVSGITEVFYDSHPHVQQFVRDVHSKSDALSLIIISGSDLDEWRAYRKQANHLPDTKLDEATSLYYYCYSIGTGALGISTFEPISDDKLEVLKRFRNVFDLAYRRYIDITTAEAQAREAQIEAALERVRSKAMAMHKSEDLTPAVATVFSELDRLGFRTVRCGIGIFNDLSRRVDVWTTSSNDNRGSSVHLSGNEVLEGHPLLEGIFEAWQLQKDYSYVLQGKDLINYYRVAADSNLPVSAPEVNSDTTKQYYHCIMFPSGGLFAFRESEFSMEAKSLMRRFADVFQLTFTRHLDLRQAEAQNKIIQAENERKTNELEEARQLQLSMLPKELPKLPNLDIAVYMKTATEVGGDYYDFNVGVDGTLTVAIGDATGHGMKAGTIVSMIKALFASGGSRMDMKSYFKESSDALKGIELGRLMMAFLMLKINSHKLQFANAGMPPLFIYRSRLKEVEEMMIHGMPLGAIKDFPYEISQIEISSGDTLLLLSDGLPELKNEKEEQYSYIKVKEEFKVSAEKSPDEIVEHLKNSSSQWANGTEPDDDVTFVVIKIK